MSPRQWRRVHRWLGTVAAAFLLFAAATGIACAAVEFFGADEAERERLRAVPSQVTTAAVETAWAEPLRRAFAAAAQRLPGAPVDRVVWECKTAPPRVTLFLGRPGGGEDRRLDVDAATGAVLAEGDYADKPFLWRLHSGEAFGDGGLVAGMLWGLALVVLTVSGVVLWWQLRRRHERGLRRWFW